MVQRYRPDSDEQERSFEMIPDDGGDYVAYEDYKELEDERDELRDDLSRDKAILQSMLDREHEERKELEAENTRLRMLRDAAESRAQGLEEENKYLRAGCQDDTRQCPIVGTNNTLVDKAKELEAENKRLRELVDGATVAVELFKDTAPAQKKWREEWLNKAREALKEARYG